MKSSLFLSPFGPVAALLCIALTSPLVATAGPDFARDIRPIFSENCFACHGPDENAREGELRFDTMEEAIETGVIVPGSPDQSFLVDRIMSDNKRLIMPPPKSKKTLTDDQRKLIVDWIAEGAVTQPHWAFQPVREPDPVTPTNTEWIAQPLDAFVLAELEAKNIAPAPSADSEMLLRRATLDLTGLPPTLEEMNAFLADPSPEAYASVLDRLLASPRYGEQMAANWLDLARYADTFGYQSDVENHVWPWRDWVIRAYNENLPYDDFITWQLAGDLLPNPTQDQRLATAFNRLHRQTNEGGSVAEEFRLEYVSDRTQTFGTAVLGLTLECAQCHDHKYDPTSQKEYYQLTAFFSSIDESGVYSHFTQTPPTPAMFLYEDGQEQELMNLRAAIETRRLTLEQSNPNAKWQFLKWLAQAETATVRPPIIKLSFDAELQDGKLSNDANPEKPATVSGAYQSTEGRQGQAALFNGENSVDVRGLALFERYDPFSISMWIKPTVEKPMMVLAHRSKASFDAASRGYEILLDEARPVFSLVHFWPGNALRIRALAPVPTNEWTHISATYDGSSTAAGMRIYVNGQPAEHEVLRDRLYRTIRYSDGDDPVLQIAARFRDPGFEGGHIDDFQVHDVELHPIEVASLASEVPFAETIAELRKTESGSDQVRAYVAEAHDDARIKALAELREARKAEYDFVETLRQVMIMEEKSESPPVHLLGRGDYRNKLEEVSAAVPDFLPAFPEDAPPNRLGLAQWLFVPDHPLTARVAVNNLWKQIFGHGIVRTPEDFGLQGDPPDNPALLDHLAVRYRALDWDTKALLKEIMLSSTYRQSSEVDDAKGALDPENKLLARGPRHRLSAEEIRDAALFASGLMTPRIGGPSAKPYQPEGLWRDASSVTYTPDTGENLYRRSMYTFIKRTVPPPSMLTFDATPRETCVASRERTKTPLQALVLLNDPQFVEASRVLAEQMIATEGDQVESALAKIFQSLTSRRPTEAQTKILCEAHAEQLAWFEKHPKQAEAYLAVGEKPASTELHAPSLAAMTAVVQLVMNFDAFQMNQ